MLRIVIDKGRTLEIPHAVEHAGDVAVNEYVRLKTGTDLEVLRQEELAKRAAARESAARELVATPNTPVADTEAKEEAAHVAAALEAARRAIPVDGAPIAEVSSSPVPDPASQPRSRKTR